MSKKEDASQRGLDRASGRPILHSSALESSKTSPSSKILPSSKSTASRREGADQPFGDPTLNVRVGPLSEAEVNEMLKRTFAELLCDDDPWFLCLVRKDNEVKDFGYLLCGNLQQKELLLGWTSFLPEMEDPDTNYERRLQQLITEEEACSSQLESYFGGRKKSTQVGTCKTGSSKSLAKKIHLVTNSIPAQRNFFAALEDADLSPHITNVPTCDKKSNLVLGDWADEVEENHSEPGSDGEGNLVSNGDQLDIEEISKEGQKGRKDKKIDGKNPIEHTADEEDIKGGEKRMVEILSIDEASVTKRLIRTRRLIQGARLAIRLPELFRLGQPVPTFATTIPIEPADGCCPDVLVGLIKDRFTNELKYNYLVDPETSMRTREAVLQRLTPLKPSQRPIVRVEASRVLLSFPKKQPSQENQPQNLAGLILPFLFRVDIDPATYAAFVFCKADRLVTGSGCAPARGRGIQAKFGRGHGRINHDHRRSNNFHTDSVINDGKSKSFETEQIVASKPQSAGARSQGKSSWKRQASST